MPHHLLLHLGTLHGLLHGLHARLHLRILHGKGRCQRSERTSIKRHAARVDDQMRQADRHRRAPCAPTSVARSHDTLILPMSVVPSQAHGHGQRAPSWPARRPLAARVSCLLAFLTDRRPFECGIRRCVGLTGRAGALVAEKTQTPLDLRCCYSSMIVSSLSAGPRTGERARKTSTSGVPAVGYGVGDSHTSGFSAIKQEWKCCFSSGGLS